MPTFSLSLIVLLFTALVYCDDDRDTVPVFQCPFNLPKDTCLASTLNFAQQRQLDARHLRPADIQFIMAAGDSITAGLFSTWHGDGEFDFLRLDDGIFNGCERRRSSFVTGTDPSMITLHNLLSKYSPNLMGGSRRNTKLQYQGTDAGILVNTDLNAAVSAAKVQDLSRQITRLSSQLTHYAGTLVALDDGSIHNRYGDTQSSVQIGAKLLNVMVGGINACWQCSTFLMFGAEGGGTAKVVRQAFNDSLRVIYETPILSQFRIHQPSRNATLIVKSPIYVSLTLLPETMLSALYFIKDSSTYCTLMQDIAVLCKCAYDSDLQQRLVIHKLMLAYNAGIRAVAEWWTHYLKRQGRDNDIKIHVNDALEHLVLMAPREQRMETLNFNSSSPAVTYAASLVDPVDCFHPTRCTHEALAIAIWNNLLGVSTDNSSQSWDGDEINRMLNVPGRNQSVDPQPVTVACATFDSYFV